jgi:hypothetical protein
MQKSHGERIADEGDEEAEQICDEYRRGVGRRTFQPFHRPVGSDLHDAEGRSLVPRQRQSPEKKGTKPRGAGQCDERPTQLLTDAAGSILIDPRADMDCCLKSQMPLGQFSGFSCDAGSIHRVPIQQFPNAGIRCSKVFV